MSRARHWSAVLPCVAALLAGCGVDDAPGAGDEGALTNRVVSVSKQINEFVYAIGAEDHLVARDLTSVFPPEIRELPSVGYHRALSAEGIISMEPTVFLTDGNVGPDAVLDQLRKVGIPIRVIEPGRSVEEAQAMMAELGRFFHREQAADSVLEIWRAEMGRLWQDTARWAEADRPRVLMIHFGQIANNYLAIARGSTADRILGWAGGVNALDSIGGMKRITPELIARAAPDVILATEVGFDRFGSAENFRQLPGVELTPAASAGRIYRIEEQDVMYFGPRTAAAVARIEKLIHPVE